jgi:hypothetical protein
MFRPEMAIFRAVVSAIWKEMYSVLIIFRTEVVVYWVVAYLLVCRARRAKMQDDARNFTINTHEFYSQYLRRERVLWQTLISTTNGLGGRECRTTGGNYENLIISQAVKIKMYILFK